MLLVLVVIVALVGLHYLPYYTSARSALDGARQLATEVRDLQVSDLNSATLQRLHTEVSSLQQNVASTQGLLATDPLVGFARSLSQTADQVKTADHVIDAAGHLIDAAQVALSMGDRFLDVRQGPPDQLLGGLVGLVATSIRDVATLKTDLDAADAELALAQPTATGSLLDATNQMTSAIEHLRPLIDLYDTASAIVPSLLGFGGERRYLVLAQDPAELRPSGGYTGTYGIVTFTNGELTSHNFNDIYSLDLKPGAPYVQPPDALSNHLLGDMSWQLADANWSPDWPTAASDALRLYTNESGDTHIDGVIALTTYALDGILGVIGPVSIPDYNVTINSGQVTVTTLEHTRGSGDLATRKAFLEPLATAVLDKLQSLPDNEWQPMADAVQQLAEKRLIMVWSADPTVEKQLAAGPLGGEILQNPGDYLAVSEANVAPTSKYNLVVHRSTQLGVTIAADGSVQDSLGLTWQNDAANAGDLFAELRSFSTSIDGFYGAYVRVLVPSGSQVLNAIGHDSDDISGVESVDPEAGRDALGNYLLMPPGQSTLEYTWQSTAPATETAGRWTYRLTVQKQPGTLAEPFSMTVALPAGASVTSAPAGATIDGNHVTLTTSFEEDMDLSVQYRLP